MRAAMVSIVRGPMTSTMWTNMWSGVPTMVVLNRRGVLLIVMSGVPILVVLDRRGVLIVIFIIVSLCNTAEANEYGYRSCQCECAFRAEL
jgi:hypothetical protein